MSRCLNELKTFQNPLKSLKILVKIVSQSSGIMDSIEPFICNKSIKNAFQPQAILVLLCENHPKPGKTTYPRRSIFYDLEV